MKLIADSGSSKTDWVLMDELHQHQKQYYKTQGLNPYFVRPDDFIALVEEGLHPSHIQPTQIHFYGAGCTAESKRSEVESNLRKIFPHAKVEVNNDLLGAARALCGKNKGIACILGTGSNACLFNGEEIIEEATSLGFILGDEGGGAYLGKALLTAFLYNELPEDLLEKFVVEYHLDKATILDNIYRKPYPNRYLADFVPFLVQYKSHRYVSNLVGDAFDLFINRHIKSLYNYRDFECHFVGSVAFVFESLLTKKVEQHGLKMGQIMNKPIDGLIRFHEV